MKFITTLLLVICIGCAAGRVQLKDGSEVSGIVMGQSKLEFCEHDGTIGTPTSGDAPVGVESTHVAGPCARIEGGALSTFTASVLGALISGAVVVFTHGVF